mgnify:CR=1 FL=1
MMLCLNIPVITPSIDYHNLEKIMILILTFIFFRGYFFSNSQQTSRGKDEIDPLQALPSTKGSLDVLLFLGLILAL